MKLPTSPFTVTDWSKVEPTKHAGETGQALWRTLNIGDLRVRMVEYSPGYLADHWCDRGHVIFVVKGRARFGAARRPQVQAHGGDELPGLRLRRRRAPVLDGHRSDAVYRRLRCAGAVNLHRKIENPGEVPGGGWCLEVAQNSRYIVIIDTWPNDWAASPRLRQARTLQMISPKHRLIRTMGAVLRTGPRAYPL
ncbi:hypothetical protein AB7M41_006768 [Bradyrhizobium diazoefficiens]